MHLKHVKKQKKTCLNKEVDIVSKSAQINK